MVPILGRHPEQFADHMNGQRERVLRDEVRHRAPGRQPLQQLADNLLDARPQRLDPPGNEHRGDQLAQPRVVGWVDPQHRIAHRGPHPRAQRTTVQRITLVTA